MARKTSSPCSPKPVASSASSSSLPPSLRGDMMSIPVLEEGGFSKQPASLASFRTTARSGCQANTMTPSEMASYLSLPTQILPGFDDRYPSRDCPRAGTHHMSGDAGALQPGGPVNLLARENIGLLVNYFAVGIFNGVFPAIVYPLFKIYLDLQGYQSNSASSLLNFAWYLKFPLGFISDCVPINGYRRKPYIFLGWLFLITVMGTLTFMPPVEPHKRRGEVVNPDASAQSPRYVIPLMAASIGYLLADVACDGIMVEYAHRESELQRGNAQTMVYGVRFSAELLGTLVVALGLNSEEYGGNFSYSLPQGVLFGFLTLVGVLALFASYFNLQDQRVVGQPLRHQLQGVWRIMQHRATWQITAYGFIQFFTFAFDVSPSNTINEVWLGIDPLLSSLFYCVNSGIYALATYMMRQHLLNTNWRTIVVVSIIGGTLVGLPSVLLTVFDVYRDKYFYLAKDQLIGFFDALAMMVRLVVIVEIAEPGLESSTYSLITTVYNLAIPVMTTTSNLLGSVIDVYDDDVERDTLQVRWHVAIAFFVKYGLRLVVNLAILPLLPRQKHQANELKLNGSSNKFVGAMLFAFFGVIFFASLTSNLMSIFASTACLRFAGGEGC